MESDCQLQNRCGASAVWQFKWQLAVDSTPFTYWFLVGSRGTYEGGIILPYSLLCPTIPAALAQLVGTRDAHILSFSTWATYYYSHRGVKLRHVDNAKVYEKAVFKDGQSIASWVECFWTDFFWVGLWLGAFLIPLRSFRHAMSPSVKICGQLSSVMMDSVKRMQR